jgi:hypothetical protein
MVNTYELRCHGTRQNIAELSFDLRAHDRDIAIIGVSALRAAQTDDPLEEFGIALHDAHGASLWGSDQNRKEACNVAVLCPPKTASVGDESRSAPPSSLGCD